MKSDIFYSQVDKVAMRWDIINAWKNGEMSTEIAKRLGISYATVRRIRHKFMETGTVENKKIPGRKVRQIEQIKMALTNYVSFPGQDCQ